MYVHCIYWMFFSFTSAKKVMFQLMCVFFCQQDNSKKLFDEIWMIFFGKVRDMWLQQLIRFWGWWSQSWCIYRNFERNFKEMFTIAVYRQCWIVYTVYKASSAVLSEVCGLWALLFYSTFTCFRYALVWGNKEIIDDELIRRWLQLRFDCDSTARQPFDDLHHDCVCGLLLWSINNKL